MKIPQKKGKIKCAKENDEIFGFKLFVIIVFKLIKDPKR